MAERTNLINQLRAILLERGVIFSAGRHKLKLGLHGMLADDDSPLSPRVRPHMLTQTDQNTVKSYLQTGRAIRSFSFIASVRPQIVSALQALLDTFSRSGG